MWPVVPPWKKIITVQLQSIISCPSPLKPSNPPTCRERDKALSLVLSGGINPYDPDGRAQISSTAQRLLRLAAARMMRVPAPRVAAAAHPERDGEVDVAAAATAAAVPGFGRASRRCGGGDGSGGGGRGDAEGAAAGPSTLLAPNPLPDSSQLSNEVPAHGPVNLPPQPTPAAVAAPARPDPRHARMALAELMGHKHFLAWAAERVGGPVVAPEGGGARAAGGPAYGGGGAGAGEGRAGDYVRPLKLQCALNLFGLNFTMHALALDPGG